MIISASRRTDIPACYSQWWLNRLREGYVLIPNPHNPGRLARVALSPAHVDCIVFWTKNPIPMLDKFDVMTHMGYRYYVQFTLTPYDQSTESNLPSKQALLRALIHLSEKSARSVWFGDTIQFLLMSNIPFRGIWSNFPG